MNRFFYNTTGYDSGKSAEPKNKKEGAEKITNRQDDNSYDEVMNIGKKTEPDNKRNAEQLDFEYTDSGEFTSNTPVNKTDTQEEYL
jgi:hypothetical protein